MRRGLTGLLAILLATVMVAAACGGDDEPTTAAEAPPAPAPAADDGAAEAPAPADAPAEAPADAPAEPPPPPPGAEDITAALVFDIGGRGDQSFNDSAAAGLDRAAAQLGVNTTEASPNPDGSNRAELLQLSADGAELVIGVGFLFGESITEVAANNPDTFFGIIDSAPEGTDNLAGLVFAEHEGSFL
ncbi:MAG: BMP family ABC transporter substrate-binding protein, partial [bacterium]|nr:BMP family ABC transporter substrate-binding protein [bacterium]